MEGGNLLAQFSDQLAALVERAAPAVVQVRGRHARPRTGTVVGPGLVLSTHPGRHAEQLQIEAASGASGAATFVGGDPSTGICALRVEGGGFPALSQAGEPAPGQVALALARTWSGALAATAGIVSVVGGPLRTGRGPAIEQVVRADLRVHPLGAGGPLIDASGRLIGVATGATLRGWPLFIPGSIALRVADAIVAQGGIKRGYLGINAQPVRLSPAQLGSRAETGALLVVGVGADGPADKGGVLIGDIIVRLDGHAIEDHDDLLELLAGERVGKAVPVDVVRGGELRTLQVTIGRHE